MEYMSNIITFVLIWIFAVSPTVAYYCEWGYCESWKYCCAENACCNYYDIWTTIVIIAGVVIGLVFAGTCLYYNLQCIYNYLQRRYYGIDSVSIPSQFESDARPIRPSYH